MCFLAARKVCECTVVALRLSNITLSCLRNSWSNENVSTVVTEDAVECVTTHLTSFSVLVVTQDGSRPNPDNRQVSLSNCVHFACLLIAVILDTVFHHLHWLFYINILFDSYNDCNSILEVCVD